MSYLFWLTELIAVGVFGIFALIAFCLSIWNWIELRAMKLSTHQVQFVEAKPTPGVNHDDEGFENITDKTRDKFMQDDLDLDPLYDDGTTEALRPRGLQKKATRV